jgi:hypothetical protein
LVDTTKILNPSGTQINSSVSAAALVDRSSDRKSQPSTSINQTYSGPGADYKRPQGSDSVPQPGNSVWVFFLNGDLQKPVYFALVTEAYANARVEPPFKNPPPGENLIEKPFKKLNSPGGNGGDLGYPVPGDEANFGLFGDV